MKTDDARQEEAPPDTAAIIFTIDANGIGHTFPLVNPHSRKTAPLANAVMRLMSNHPEELDDLYLKAANVQNHRNG